MAKTFFNTLALGFFFGSTLYGEKLPLVEGAEVQPLVAHAMRLAETLSFMGNILGPQDVAQLQALKDESPSAETALAIQELLDPYCLALVEINPETRVKVLRGPAGAELVQGGWKSFLVKVNNQAEITSRLEVESPNAASLFRVASEDEICPVTQDFIPDGELTRRFLDLTLGDYIRECRKRRGLGMREFDPLARIAGRADNVRVRREQLEATFQANEIGMLLSGFVTVHELSTLTHHERNALNAIYVTLHEVRSAKVRTSL